MAVNVQNPKIYKCAALLYTNTTRLIYACMFPFSFLRQVCMLLRSFFFSLMRIMVRKEPAFSREVWVLLFFCESRCGLLLVSSFLLLMWWALDRKSGGFGLKKWLAMD